MPETKRILKKMCSCFSDATAVLFGNTTEVLLRRKTVHGNYGVFDVIMQYCSSILFAAGQGVSECAVVCVCDSMYVRAVNFEFYVLKIS